MKKMILCCLVAVLGCGVFAVEAKTPQKKGEIVTTVFTVDIDCESCAARIMNNVPVIGKGIKDIQVDVPSKEVTVTYDSAKTSPEELKSKEFGKNPGQGGRKTCQIVIYGLVNLDGEPGFRRNPAFSIGECPSGKRYPIGAKRTGCIRNKGRARVVPLVF